MNNVVSDDVVTEWLHAFESFFEGNISRSDFKELKGSFVVKIYMSFVKLRMKANLDNLASIGLDAKPSVVNHAPAFSLLVPRVAKLLNQFFARFYEDSSFGLLDMITPSQDRTCRFFNYLVDYIHKFDSRTAPLIKKAQDDVEQQITRKEELDLVICEQEKKLEQLHCEQEEAALECLQVDEQIIELKNKLLNLDELRKKNTVIYEEAKARDNSLQKQLDSIMLECVQIEESKARLEQKVLLPHEMQSYQQLSEDLKLIQQELESKKKMLSERKEQLSSSRCMCESVSSLVTQYSKEFNDVFAKLKSLHAVSPLTNSEACQAIEEGDMQLQLARQQAATLAERRDKMEARGRDKREGLLSTIECEKEVYSQLRLSNEEELKLSEQLASVEASLRRKIEDRSGERQRDQGQIQAKYAALLAKYKQRQEEVSAAVLAVENAIRN